MTVPRSLVEEALDLYATTHDDCVVRPSIPILYFGDGEQYIHSPIKVVTVALNPSHHEFPEGDRFARFPDAMRVDPVAMEDAGRAAYLAALDAYFREKPYRAWFGWFDEVLRGIGASYYPGEANAALHTDLCSPLATNPTWSRLGPRRNRLELGGMALWHRLVDWLAPDVIVVSVARRYRDRIAFARTDAWEPLLTIPRADPAKRPYQALAQRPTLPGGKKTLLVFGPAAQQPFATLDKASRRSIGRAAVEALGGG